VCFGIYDRVRVKVEPTTEFPLDLNCQVLFLEEDTAEYEEIKASMGKMKAASTILDKEGKGSQGIVAETEE